MYVQTTFLVTKYHHSIWFSSESSRRRLSWCRGHKILWFCNR